MIKIAYVLNRKDVFSGGEISLLELLARIDRTQFEPLAVCPGEGQMSRRIRDMGMETLVLELPPVKSWNLMRTRNTILELREIIRGKGVSIVHGNGSRAQFYSSCAVRGTGASLVWHVRESKKDVRLYDRFLMRSADRVIFVSEKAARDRFSDRELDKRKTSIVYNGVDTERLVRDKAGGEKTRRKFGIGEKDVLLGIVALIEPLKGHDILLQALALLRKKEPGVKLLVNGKTVNERFRKALEKAVAETGLEGAVIFGGYEEDITNVLSALDIFVLPSRREGFSRALIEAMSCSLPVVASSVGGNMEAVKDRVSGLLVPYGDPEALAEALLELVSDPGAAREMGAKGRKRAEELFSIEQHVAHVQNLYYKLK
ncbi:MAG: glycosyltransferase [Candidatus Omnitrophica bacterium]|nr:glycosyltransferase [Candidatus Omnitrophota bacterium]